MIAEILSTGEEVLAGRIMDTNSSHIAAQLELAGVRVTRHICVGDDLDAIAGALCEIKTRAELAVVTGGLGPTHDDCTAAAAALAGGRKLIESAQAVKWIQKWFQSHGLAMSPSNRKQAMLPEGADGLYNAAGTAPGFCMRMERCRFFFLPGVPHEMRRMLADEVMPEVRKDCLDRQRPTQRTLLSVIGLPESVLGEKLAEFEQRFSHLKLGICASFPTIDVHIEGQHEDAGRLEMEMQSARRWVLEKLGDAVFSVQGRELAAEIGALLVKRKQTLAVAESCTGGMIATMLTDTGGSSDYFLAGAVTYANAAKSDMLSVPAELVRLRGAVDIQVAEQMAAGIRKTGQSTWAIATTGVAGPTGGTPEKPVGTVCIGVAGPQFAIGHLLIFPDFGRHANRRMFAHAALDLLRRGLLDLPLPAYAAVEKPT